MTVQFNYREGQRIYLVNDPEQVEYRLNRIIYSFCDRLELELFCPDGEILVVPEVHTSKKKDIVKMLNSSAKEDGDE